MKNLFKKSKIVASGEGNVKVQGYEPEIIALYSSITKSIMEILNLSREDIIEILDWIEEFDETKSED